MNRLLASLAMIVLLGGCAPPPAEPDSPDPPPELPDTAADELAVRAHGQTWLDHYIGGDIDALMALYEPDAILALHDQPVRRGIDEIRAFFEPGLGKSAVEFKLDIEDVEVHGDLAWLVSKYWLRSTSKDSGYVYEDAGRSLIIYRRGADGEWRIAADIDNNTPDVSMDSMPL